MNWIRVEDSMPLNTQDVLFTDGKEIYYGARWYGNLWCDKTRRDRDGDYLEVYDITHWMKLPQPPREK